MQILASSLISLPPHFYQVAPGVYRGARPSDSQVQALESLESADGSLTLIDLQGGDELAGWLEPGELPTWIHHEGEVAVQAHLQFLSLPLSSVNEVDASEARKIRQSIQLMREAFQAPNSRQVFLHCEHGTDRTGLIAALFRVQVQKWTPAQAYDEWQNLGHSEFPNHTLTHNLDEYFFRMTHWNPDDEL